MGNLVTWMKDETAKQAAWIVDGAPHGCQGSEMVCIFSMLTPPRFASVGVVLEWKKLESDMIPRREQRQNGIATVQVIYSMFHHVSFEWHLLHQFWGNLMMEFNVLIKSLSL